MWQDTLPDGFHIDEPIRLTVAADIRPDGTFGREWLVITEKRLLVLTTTDSTLEARWDLSLADLEEPKTRDFTGGGALEVTHGKTPIELVRYTSARAPRFATAAGVLGKWLKGEEADVPDEEMQRCGNCGLPLQKGTKVCPACTPKHRTVKRLAGYLRPFWPQALALSCLAVLSTALGLLPPYLQKPLIDDVLTPSDRTGPQRLSLLAVLVLLLLGARLVSSAAGALMGWLSAWLGNRITHGIRCKLYRHLQYLSLSFFDKRQMGTVISRVNQDTGRLQEFLVWGSQDLAINLLLLVGIGVVLFVLNWQLALLVFVPAPIIAFVSTRFWKRIHYYMHRFFHRWGKLNAVLSETLNGLRIVKAFAQERREVRRFADRSSDLADSGIVAERAWSIMFTGIQMILTLGVLLVWYVGGRQIIFDPKRMTVGTLIAFVAYVWMSYRPIQFISLLLNWASRSLTAAERVFEVLDTEPEVKEDEKPVAMPRIEGRVQFSNVHFGYERHRPVIKGMSFKVEPGEMIGLVGKSGAGKSTTINLLCRFYDVTEGEILIDGVPLGKISLNDLRSQIGLVPQDTFLFGGTILENISYANPDATREQIVQAAKVANAHEFILKKPDGYETMLGEDGKGVSAGEKQRLAIARAVLHDPRILILDEATSQVDVDTEKKIQVAIDRLVSGRTTFAIAHRLSTLKNADRLIVLKEGEIEEMGTHGELLAKEDGEFHKLVKTYQEISKVREVNG